MRRKILFILCLCLGLTVPVMAQGEVELTDSTSGDWIGGQGGDLDPNHPAIKVTAKSYTRVYGDANPTFEYTSEGATLVGVPEITCEATATSPVGTYPIIIKKGSVTSYNVTYVEGTLTITKAPLSVKAGTYTKKQGDPLPEFTLTYDGFKNNETEAVLTKQVVVSCDANMASEPGEYPITLSGAEAENYDISYTNGKLIVTQAYIHGDVNGDGEVNVADLVAVSNHMAGDETVSKEKADVNSDGEVNVADLVAISNIMSGNAE